MNASIITLVLAVVFAADTQPVKPEIWQNPASWKKIKAGQTTEQISRTLGDSAATESSNAIEAWFYSDVPKTDENGRTVRPTHGFLIFRKTPSGNTLQKWVEPDWQTMLTWAQLQNDYKKAIAEQKAAARAQLMEERKQQAEQAAAERAERQKAAIEAKEQRKQAIAAAAAARKPSQVRRSEALPDPDAHTKLSSRYFITIGICFFVIAFIIAGSYGFKLFKS